MSGTPALPSWERIEMPEGACDCASCRKIAALMAEPWTWDDDLRVRPHKSLYGGIAHARGRGDSGGSPTTTKESC